MANVVRLPPNVGAQARVLRRRRVSQLDHRLEGGAGVTAAPPPGAAPASSPALLEQLQAFIVQLAGAARSAFATTQLPASLSDRTIIIGSQSVQVGTFRSNRRYLFLLNIGAANPIFISFGQPAAISQGVILAANNGFYEPAVVPCTSINAISAGSTLVIVEG